MLLALRSLFEPTVTPPVVVPPGFGGGGGGYRPQLPPVSRPRPTEAAEIVLKGIQVKVRAGKLTATGGSTVFLPTSGEVVFELGRPIIQAAASAMPKGISVLIENSHRDGPASVTLGLIESDRPDDDEAAMLLFLGSQ